MWSALLVATVLAPAHARKPRERTYSVTLLERPEPDPYGRTSQAATYIHVHDGARLRTADEEIIVDGGKLQLSCAAEKGGLVLRVLYDTGNYPEHLPEEIGCVVGDVDVTVQIRGIPPLYDTPEDVRASPEVPAEWRRRGSSSGTKVFGLPEDTWTLATVPATTADGGDWKDVTCEVLRAPEGPLLRVRVADQDAPDRDGHCALPTDDGRTITIPVRLVTVQAHVPRRP